MFRVVSRIAYPTKHQFDQIFEGVYQGAGLSHKPWFSVLGNHDWGGDLIARTKKSNHKNATALLLAIARALS